MFAPLSTPTAARPTRAPAADVFDLDRARVAGHFSLLHDGVLRIAAEPGLVLRVVAGCLWLPSEDAACSVGRMAGEQVTLARGGTLLASARRGTQIELVWPATNPPRCLH